MQRRSLVILGAALLVGGCDATPMRATPAPAIVPLTTGPGAAAPPAAPAASSAQAPTPAPRSVHPGAMANVDPADDDVVAPPEALPDCEERLAKAGVTFRRGSLPVHAEHKIVCGAPQVVVYLRGPGKIDYDPTPLMTCSMALALATFEGIVQEEAERAFHARVVRVTQLGTYSCREIAAYPGWVSEHAYANAIDLASFVLQGGRRVEVVREFDREESPARAAGQFLRSVSQRAFDEDVFSHVLTPFFDAHHRDHFHLDLARYRGDGTRPEGA